MATGMPARWSRQGRFDWFSSPSGRARRSTRVISEARLALQVLEGQLTLRVGQDAMQVGDNEVAVPR
jgi:hypothetical protein